MWNNSPPIKKYTQPFVARMNCQKLIFQSGEMTDFRIKSSRKSRWMERLSKCIPTHPHHHPSHPQAVGKLNSCLKISVVLQTFAEANIVMAATKLTIQQDSSEQYLLSTPAWIIPGLDFSTAKLNQLEMALFAAGTILSEWMSPHYRGSWGDGVSCCTDCNDN